MMTIGMVLGVLAILAFGVAQIYHQVTSSAVAPELIGLSGEEAQALTKRAELNWQQTAVNHDTVPAGIVISQSPDADTAMTKGDSMVVAISLGPVAALVPDLLGMSREDAAAKLKEKGFVMVVSKIASTEPVNMVISQSPERNEPTSQGAEVEVTISGGSTLVPDVSGKTSEEAIALLAESNLAVGKMEYTEIEDERQIGLVVTQFPTAGTMATVQAQVALTVAKRSKAYHSEVSVTLLPAEEGRTLRVTLMENGEEVEQYASVLPATGSESSLLVPVSSDIQGRLLSKIYINDALVSEQEVELQ